MTRECNRGLTIFWALSIGLMTLLAIYQYGMLGLACIGSLFSTGVLVVGLIRSYVCLASNSDDLEQQQANGIEGEEDSPPSYEVVTSKPPPYSLLYTSCSSTQPQSPISSLETVQVEHLHYHKSMMQLWTLAEQEASPPSFSQAMRFKFDGICTSVVPTEDTLPSNWGTAPSTPGSEVTAPSTPSSTAPSVLRTDSADSVTLTTESPAHITPSSGSTHMGHLSAEVTPT